MPTRQEMWNQLSGPVDLLIIGGGINGAGIARDAARRGLSVALVEMSDLAFGTSSRSSKLVHGGLRYLEQFEFGLVFESVSERRILLDIAPHLVNPLGFLFPVYRESRHNLLTINAGMWLYEGLSLFRSPKRHRKLGPDDVAQEEPCLMTKGLKGAPLYYDCSTDDARLTLESALDAAQHGSVIATWAQAVAFVKDDAGRITEVEIEDQLTQERKTIAAHTIINATGPWTDRTISMSQELKGGSLLRPTQGSHIVVEHSKLPVNNAVVCFHPDDGRVLFAIPWGDRTYLGTTDTDFEGDPAEVVATAEDVAYIIDASNAYFPDHPLTPDDVISTWSGLRPLMRPTKGGDDVDESSVSREHQIVVGQDGLITIAGGKLTTYRKMSKEVVDTAVKLLRLSGHLPDDVKSAETDREPLPGAVGWPADDDHDKVTRRILEEGGEALTEASARELTRTYGMRGLEIARMVRDDPKLAAPLNPGRPEILAQVDWSVQQELAATLDDILVRRTQIFYRDHDQGLGGLEAIADRMAELLDWDDATRQRNIDAYTRLVEESRRWKQG